MKTKNFQEPRKQVDLTWAIILFLATIIYALFFQEEAPLDVFILSNSFS
jgi:hypothetical protein